MQYGQFISKVEEYAGFESTDDATRLTKATLETLGERLSRKERDDLASEIPEELKTYLVKRENRDLFTVGEFFQRVEARADCGLPRAVIGARAVIMALREAVSTGELGNIIREFPSEYEELFSRRPDEPLSPTIR